ncbi:LacI family transcriptional regulator [Arachnia propionica]|uniref:LacI family transcriptional regulator n=1 Tax=Arachnia propionica TaxID=1750 RepID=A0A3P1TBG5_9ACTN|nr:LacI family DNA-binding transcriptional regulator [Arachnia propionica]MDO5082102.1 LacI family DNA-binding transcriptional regulator [Arachnia propionica]RRD06650.1 LacI family transcriptional regulator [Arachnia propionica]
MSKRVGVAEVAARAGVSPGTVSNTLNHPERVSPATRAQVLAAVKELGFIPNQQARVLTGAASNLLGLVVVDLMSPFFMELAHAVERTAADAGYVMILSNSENDHDREETVMRTLAAQRVVGSLLTPAGGGTPLDESTHGVPLVLIDHTTREHPCSVSVDHVAGGRMAAEHLISLGHTRLGFVAGQPNLRQFTERERGVRDVMAEAGLDPSTLRVVRADGIGQPSGLASGRQLLQDGDLPTGICCCNDMLAFGVYRALTQGGVTVPDDVALVGYDDVDFAANWIVPLTSVSQPTALMGEQAARLLIDHATNPDHEHERVVLQPRLIVRRSTTGESSGSRSAIPVR